MSPAPDLRDLYRLGAAWDQAAAALGRLAGPAATRAPSARALAEAADSCRQMRAALLADPDAPACRLFLAATRLDTRPHALADWLEHLAATLTRLRESPAEAAMLPRPALARLGDFMAEAGHGLLRVVAQRAARPAAS